jgi:dolichyl-phosphate beta-glucosyltransferase
MELRLSLIIPAYDEARRLPRYLAAARGYLDRRYPGSYEVLVVDDGSRDDLPSLLERAQADWPELKAIRHPRNRGKGAAVRTGMLAGRGELLLFADADGATPIDQEGKLADAVHGGADVAIGSRLTEGDAVTRSRTWSRGLAGRAFARLARWCLEIPVRDTQCGFKIFRRAAAHALFGQVTETGFLFDLEVLALAQRGGYRVVEVPVNWSEIPGGHLHVFRESLRTLPALWRLRRRLARANFPS